MSLSPGQRIQHYQIVDKIGEGGMGAVWRALDTKLGREVALKVLPESMAADPDRLARFKREATVVASLSHPNIVTLFSVEDSDGLHYLTMELVAGRPLGTLLPASGLSLERLLDYALPLADALASAHARGVVHRDLKPDNVMIADEGDRLKVLDFGLAKWAQGAAPEGGADDSTLMQTRAGNVLGTPHYMSPEQARGREVDHRSDLFSFGVMLFEMATGQRPFSGESMVELLSAVIKDEAPSPNELRRDLPEKLGSVIARCLAKDPDDRYASASDLVQELRSLQRQSISGASSAPTVELETASRPTERSRPRRVLIAALFGAAFVAVAAWWALSRGEQNAAGVAMAGRQPDEQALAVFPFSVRGSEALDYLEEGMVDLLSSRLEGLGAVRIISPRSTFAQLKSAGIELSDPGAEVELAQLVGASSYITGDVVQLADKITVTAYWNELGDSSHPLQSTVEGTSDQLFALLDSLVADLATHSVVGPGERLDRSAALSSHSLEATKIYLEGERLLRAGLYRAAAEAYEAAIGIDPEFALAHYRKSLAADWIDAEDVRSSAEEALRFADALPSRDRDLLEALLLRRHGRNQEAEQAYRAILHRFPDDVEALLQLGEVLFHDNPRVGRSMLESLEPFKRALALDPTNANARIHIARLYALLGEHEPMQEIAAKFAESSAESERLYEVEALQAFVLDDAEAQSALIERIKGKPAPFQFYAAHGVTRFARSADGAQRILAAGDQSAPLLTAVQAGVLLEQGRIEEMRRRLQRASAAGATATWDLFEAFVFTSGIVQRDERILAELVERLSALEPRQIAAAALLPPYEDMTERFFEVERDFYIALLKIQLGQVEEATPWIQKLEQAPELPGLGELMQQLLAELRAEIQLQDGDQLAALETLRQIRYEIPHAVSVRSVADGARSRYLRAELERAVGDVDVAQNYYHGLDQSWSFWDTGFRPGVYWGLAQIAEGEGREQEASTSYERLLQLWSDPDEQFLARRHEVEQRLQSLPQ